MSLNLKINKYFESSKDKIIKLSENKINNYDNTFNIIFDNNYGFNNLVLFDINTEKKIIIGKYEILGYLDSNNNFIWAHLNNYIEKYLTKI